MEDLPEALLFEIFKRITKTSDRNSLSLVSKCIHWIEGRQRDSLIVGCGLHPATEALTSLCIRFPNLTRLEIVYSGWTSNFGNQVNDQGLLVLASHCLSLTELTLSFCVFINDTGIGYLASCKKLACLKLDFAPAVSCNGILSLVVGCKNLSSLHLIRCMKVSSVGWLEYVGSLGKLEDLVIRNCRMIGESDIMKLGSGWNNLKCLEFEADANYQFRNRNLATADRWQELKVNCDALKELSLANCVFFPGGGLSLVLRRCTALEKLHLNTCVGLKDSDLITLSQNCSKLRCASLQVALRVLIGMSWLTDESLKALGQGCSMLEEVEISFTDCEFASAVPITQNGLLSMIERCPIRVLVLHNVDFNDFGMAMLCNAHLLQYLELAKCHDVSDEGILLVMNFPSLSCLKLCKCISVTDKGFLPLVNSGKLETLVIEDCPQISERGVQGAAQSVSYEQDLSWLY